MNDERMRSALRDLPAPRASADFTARVMERLDRPASRPAPMVRRLAWAAAAAAMVVGVVGWGAWRLERNRAEQADRAALAELRLEKLQFQRDLASLRQMTSDAPPVLYLGGDDSVDLVWDVRRTAQRAAQKTRPTGSPLTLNAVD